MKRRVEFIEYNPTMYKRKKVGQPSIFPIQSQVNLEDSALSSNSRDNTFNQGQNKNDKNHTQVIRHDSISFEDDSTNNKNLKVVPTDYPYSLEIEYCCNQADTRKNSELTKKELLRRIGKYKSSGGKAKWTFLITAKGNKVEGDDFKLSLWAFPTLPIGPWENVSEGNFNNVEELLQVNLKAYNECIKTFEVENCNANADWKFNEPHWVTIRSKTSRAAASKKNTDQAPPIYVGFALVATNQKTKASEIVALKTQHIEILQKNVKRADWKSENTPTSVRINLVNKTIYLENLFDENYNLRSLDPQRNNGKTTATRNNKLNKKTKKPTSDPSHLLPNYFTEAGMRYVEPEEDDTVERDFSSSLKENEAPRNNSNSWVGNPYMGSLFCSEKNNESLKKSNFNEMKSFKSIDFPLSQENNKENTYLAIHTIFNPLHLVKNRFEDTYSVFLEPVTIEKPYSSEKIINEDTFTNRFNTPDIQNENRGNNEAYFDFDSEDSGINEYDESSLTSDFEESQLRI